jgi:CBS domain-containing protein
MYARDIMDPNPTVLRPDDQIRTAARYIMEKRYRRLPVVDHAGRYLGVFGVNCLLKLILPKAVVMEKGLESAHFINENLSDLHRRFEEHADDPISMCMQKDVPVVHPDTPLLEALRVLHQTMASLPIVEKDTGRLVGDISYWDVGEKILGAEIGACIH